MVALFRYCSTILSLTRTFSTFTLASRSNIIMQEADALNRMTEYQRAKFFFLMKVTLSMGLQHQSDERFTLGLAKFAEFFDKHTLLGVRGKLFTDTAIHAGVLL